MRRSIALFTLLTSACGTDYSGFIRPHFQPTSTVTMVGTERHPFDRIIGSTVMLSVNQEWREGNAFRRRTVSGCGVALARAQILTAFHVVRDAVDIWGQAWSVGTDGVAVLADIPVRLTIVRAAEHKDVAILGFDQNDLHVSSASVAGRDARRGEEVRLMGCARGWAGGRVTDTEVNTPPVGRLRELRIRSGHGNSGAPVVDVDGNLLGIVVAGSEPRGTALYVTLDDAFDSLGR